MRGTYEGISAPAIIAERTRNRIDATFGLGALIAGFVFQAAGYVLVLGLNEEADPGLANVTVALLLSAVTTAFVLGIYLSTKRWRLSRLLSRVASEIGRDMGWGPDTGRLLVRIGQAAGFGLAPGEAPIEYIRRVFAVQLPEGTEIDLD
jgi:predicted Kef-type K+ transport protein